MPLRDALAHRLRRGYLPLQTGLVLVWLFRLRGGDAPLLATAAVESTPGWMGLGNVLGSHLVLAALATGRE